MRIRAKTGMRQPTAAPILRCRPDLLKGMPICRLNLALAWEIPRNLFQETPPLFQQCPVRFLHVATSKYQRKKYLPEAIIS